MFTATINIQICQLFDGAFARAEVPVTKEPVGLAKARWQATRRLDANSVAAPQSNDFGVWRQWCTR